METLTNELSWPDWKKKEEYEYLKTGSLEQYKWEYLKRNQDYQKDFEKYRNYPNLADLYNRKNDAEFFYRYFTCNPINIYKESLNAYSERLKKEDYIAPDTGATYSLGAKRDEFTSKYDLAYHDNMSKYDPLNHDTPGFYRINDEYPIFIDQQPFLGNIVLEGDIYADELVVKLCVSIDIDEQLEKVNQEMQRILKQIKADKKDSQYSYDYQSTINRLRILDAMRVGATDDEIIFYVFNEKPIPNKIDESYIKEELSQLEDQLSVKRRKLKKNKETAIALRDGEYIKIVKSVNYYSSNVQSGKGKMLIKEI